MISIDLPDMAICTSPGFCALPEGIFSVAQTMAVTFTFGLSSAIARMAPIMVAAPAMSYFHFLHAVRWFDGNAAGVEGHPFSNQPEVHVFRRAVGS